MNLSQPWFVRSYVHWSFFCLEQFRRFSSKKFFWYPFHLAKGPVDKWSQWNLLFHFLRIELAWSQRRFGPRSFRPVQNLLRPVLSSTEWVCNMRPALTAVCFEVSFHKTNEAPLKVCLSCRKLFLWIAALAIALLCFSQCTKLLNNFPHLFFFVN